MKAVSILVCLALAQGISANIFKKSRQPDDGLIVQPLDYINQYQQPLYQPQEQTYKQYIRTWKQNQYQHSSESASHESAQDTRDDINTLREQAKARGGKWNTPLYTTVMKVQHEQPLDDSFVWRTLQMPVNVDSAVYDKKSFDKKYFDKKNIDKKTIDKKTIDKIYAEAQKTMKTPTAEQKVKFQEAFAAAIRTPSEDAGLNATQLLKKYQYPVEEHTVKTEDGYFLTLFHIPAKQQQIRDVTKKPVVFLMHGLLGSADDWLLMGPGKSLAFLLSDAGYDVWLGNARGNKYSRRHVTKHPALSDFWQFSNDEVALFDLPAMIDFVLETTGQQKLHYVGHSQGTTAFFALAASKPVYNDKIISMHALSPMVYMNNVRSPLIRMIAPTSQSEPILHHQIGHGAFEPNKEVIATVGGDMCQKQIGNKEVCSNVNFVMSGVDIDRLNPELAPVIMAHLPAGGSTRMIKQYGQAVVTDGFRKYSHGPAINDKVYGTLEAPKYEMSEVQVPVELWSSEGDWLAHPADVARLQRDLPHATAHKVTDPQFSHMDFQFSTDAPQLVYKQLIESMNNYPY